MGPSARNGTRRPRRGLHGCQALRLAPESRSLSEYSLFEISGSPKPVIWLAEAQRLGPGPTALAPHGMLLTRAALARIAIHAPCREAMGGRDSACQTLGVFLFVIKIGHKENLWMPPAGEDLLAGQADILPSRLRPILSTVTLRGLMENPRFPGLLFTAGLRCLPVVTVLTLTSADGSTVHIKAFDDPTVLRQMKATSHWKTPLDKLPIIANPVRIVVGTSDTVVGVENSKTLASANPGAWLVQFKNATQ
jgi:hypothetical protein